MGSTDKMKNAAQEAKGKVKETTGDATDNKDMQAEGDVERREAAAEAGRREGQGRLQEPVVPIVAIRVRRGLRPPIRKGAGHAAGTVEQ